MKLSINQLKYLNSLQERKYRQKYHNFIVEGVKLADEVLKSGTHRVEKVVAVTEWLLENARLLDDGIEVIEVAAAELKKISLLATPNQVFMVVKQPELVFDPSLPLEGISLYLDDIRDPGNLGTILRIADWFGIEWVFCSPGSVEGYNPKVVQSSMGAFLRVKFLEIDLSGLAGHFPDLPIYGTVLEGESIFATRPALPVIIAIGNESKGLSEAVQGRLTHRISIPKGQGGGAESLNAAVAAGIVCAVFSNS